MSSRIQELFGKSIEAKVTLADILSVPIANACDRLVQCLLNDGKLILCGNGSSAASCQEFAASMLHHYEVERPPLPAIALTSDAVTLTALAGDGHQQNIYARQIQALGNSNDVLIILTISGSADNLLQAVKAAHDRNIDIVAITAKDGGLISEHLGPNDIELRITGDSMPRIRELHLFILHCFLDGIDNALFGQVV